MDEAGIGRSNNEIAQGWIDYYLRTGRPQSQSDVGFRRDDPNWWAVAAVMDMEFRNPARALEIVFLIARSTHDDWAIEVLGAGPLEALLAQDSTVLDFVALEIGSNPGLKAALGCAWQNAMDDETWTQVRRLAAS